MSNKAEIRATTEELVAKYLAEGGEIKTAQTRESTLGFSWQDWRRVQQGLKVASKEEIAAERERRSLIAIRNKSVELVMELLQGRYDKEIKFDIENDRLGPNGEIR